MTTSNETPAHKKTGNLPGIVAMLAAVAFFASMDASMKMLSAHYPTMQVTALRGLSALPLVLAYIAWRGKFSTLWKIRWKLHVLRVVFGLLMLSLFIYGLRDLPLTTAYTLSFIAPLLITVLSAVFLKERISPSRWLAIAAGMSGVLIVLRPVNLNVLTLGSAAVLCAALCYASMVVMMRVLARTDSTESMVFWLTVAFAVFGTLLAAGDWIPIQAQHWPLIAALAFSGFCGQLLLTEAFRRGDASAVAPFEYTALLWSVSADWVVWQALPDDYTLLGAGVIVASGVWLIRRENRMRRASGRCPDRNQ